ncbi:Uncharacterised protein [Leminorella grimontii]|nr:Uncharacterised protein [Leminorella grimontii]
MLTVWVFFQAYAGNSGPMGGDIQFEILMSQPQTIYYDFSWSTPGVSNATIGVSGIYNLNMLNG